MLADVFLSNVTVVVDEYFKEHHGVLTHFVKYLQDCMLVVVACVARIKQLEEDGLDEDKNHILQVLPEVEEETVEDRDHKIENGPLVGDAVPEQSIAKHVLDDMDECLHGQECLLRLFEDRQNQLESDDLCSNHIMADLCVKFLLIFSLHTEFHNALEH